MLNVCKMQINLLTNSFICKNMILNFHIYANYFYLEFHLSNLLNLSIVEFSNTEIFKWINHSSRIYCSILNISSTFDTYLAYGN